MRELRAIVVTLCGLLLLAGCSSKSETAKTPDAGQGLPDVLRWTDSAAAGDGAPAKELDGGAPASDAVGPTGCSAECQQKSKSLCLRPEPDAPCVACVEDAHCAGNPSAQGQRCDDNRCGCRDDGDCASAAVGPRCDAKQRVCTCLTGADCPPDRSCLPSAAGSALKHCRPPCVNDADCPDPALPSCDTGTGLCVVCASDAFCAGKPGGARCTLTGCGCISDDQCKVDTWGPRCNTSAARCGCEEQADCAGNPHGARCHEGRCGCEEQADCQAAPAGATCAPEGDADFASCRPPCSSDGDCAALGLRRCLAGACVSCQQDADCNPDGAPLDPSKRRVCNAAGSCVMCTEDLDCAGQPGRPRCKPETETCVGCLGATDCTTSTKPHCSPKNRCASCVDNSHCADPKKPVCQPTHFFCVECLVDKDCADTVWSRCDDSSRCRECLEDSDCGGHPTGKVCSFYGNCGCDNDGDCAGHVDGPECVTWSYDGRNQRFCGCNKDADCPSGKKCDKTAWLLKCR